MTTETLTNRYGTTRTWVLPTVEQKSAYATSVLTESTSMLPGLTALEAASATAYVRTLPMEPNRDIAEAWLALPEPMQAVWLEQTRAVYEAHL